MSKLTEMAGKARAVVAAIRKPYQDPSDQSEEQKTLKKIEEEVRRDAQAFAEIGTEMLQDGRYIKMRNLYQRILINNLRLMIWLPVGSPRFTERMVELQARIQTFTNIIDIPKDFVAKANRTEEPPPIRKAS